MATKSQKKNISRIDILDAFKDFVVEHEKLPMNFFAIAKSLGIKESVIYNEFSSPAVADAEVWNFCHQSTLETLQNSPEFEAYSGREKTLAYYYAWIENLLEHRSYLMVSMTFNKMSPGKLAKSEWLENQKIFFNEIVQQSALSGEVENRKYLTDKYKEGFAMTSLFILNCWKNDSSVKFQQTDQAIEKSVNLLFDFIGKSPLDSLIDFGKFLFTQKPF